MVRVRGFEPPASAFQVRSSGLSELHPVELAFPTGIEPACLPVRSRALVQLSYGKNWCDVWDSSPCCCAENADAWPLAERRMIGSGRRIRTCRDLINSQAHPPRAVDRNKLVDRLGVEPSASCLQGISPPRRSARGARTWFRATLSCSSGRRYHQISFPSVRPARIELASSEWHSEALPIDQGRMVGVPRIELGMHIGAGFTDPLSHQTWRHPIGCSGPNRTALPRGYEPRELPMLHAASKVARLELTRMRRSTSVRSQNWRTAEVLIPNALRHPSRFERARGTRRVDCPLEHVPEKACPGLDPGWEPVFGKDHAPAIS